MGFKIIIGFFLVVCSILIYNFFKLLYDESWFGTLTTTQKIDPLDVLSLIISSLITLYLAWYITKKLSEQRYEKEFVITDLKHIEDAINNIEVSISHASMIELQTLIELLGKLKLHIDRFDRTVELLEIQCKNHNLLKSSYNKLYMKVTNLDGSQLNLTSINKIEINQVCTSFILATRKLISVINKQ